MKGASGGGFFTLDPTRYDKKVSGYRHLSPWGSLSNRGDPGMWGRWARIPGSLMDE